MVKYIQLNSSLNVSSFSCCNSPRLEEYLKKYASQDIKKQLCSCFVATEDEINILGYYTLAAHSVDASKMPKEYTKQIPYKFIPAILIGRLAVDDKHQGNGYGALLLKDALKRILAISEQIAANIIVVDAKDENTANFYKKYGFNELTDNPLRLVLSVRTLKTANKKANH